MASNIWLSFSWSPASSAIAAAKFPNAFTPPERNARARGRIAAANWLYTSSVAGRWIDGITIRSLRWIAIAVMMMKFTVAAAFDRVLHARAKALRTLFLETAAVPLGKAAVDHEADEAHEKADRLGADEILGVDKRRDGSTDGAAHDLSDEHRPGEEGEEAF